MYPALLRDRQYPVKLGPVYHGIRPDALVGLCAGYGVIARVRVSCERGEYPYRTRDGTIYPVGTYTTVLAGPDIERIARDGQIHKVYDVATYTLGNPFRGAVARLLADRAEAKCRGDPDAETFAKLCVNSLAGRTARREGGWIRRTKLDGLARWGDTYQISAERGTMTRHRYIAGAAWEWREDKLPRGPHTAVFAYLTAYGRQQMRDVRDALPAKSVVAQDTDGLYLLPVGIRALIFSGTSRKTGPGRLRVTGAAESGMWYGPRHYRWGSKWVLAGMPYESVDSTRMTVTYSSRTPLFNCRADRAPDAVYRVRRTVAIPSDLERGRVQPDGWILPPRIIPGRTVEG
jgi:hypothetical protein